MALPRAIGKYQVLGSIGRGGMGDVFKALQPDLNRHVAIKTLLAGEQATEDFLQRFQREARLAAKLVHPNIVQIHDIGAEGKLHYLVMEFVEGLSLRQLMADRKLDVDKSLRIAHTIGRALQFAHDQGIIHRDIKPANVLIDRQGRVRILDFGLAKSMTDGKGLTATGTMVGTPHYMSPEQAFGASDEVDGRTDLYSLGAMLYEMATGRPPFDGATVLAILRRIEEEEPAPPKISPQVDAVILKALEKDRAKRFQSAAEMVDALKACLTGQEKSEVTVGPTRVRNIASPRRRLWPWLVAAGAALLVWRMGPSGKPLPPPSENPEAELRALLARTPEPSDGDLARFTNPPMRRMIAQHRMKGGQYGRAMKDLEGYERLVAELASAPKLQRFVSPGLFPVGLGEYPALSGAPGFLLAAARRHFEGKQQAAREKLKAAAAMGAPPAQVALVRAHIDLWDVCPDPESKGSTSVLKSLRAELDPFGDLHLLPLQALAAVLDKDMKGAWDKADRLLAAAPNAAETYILRAILLQREGKFGPAEDILEDAARLSRDELDATPQCLYLRLVAVLNDPENEKLDAVEMRRELDERLQDGPHPMAHLLRGVLHALDSRWDEAETDLQAMAARASTDRAWLDHSTLGAFVWLGGAPRSRLLAEARELQALFGRMREALATAEQVTGEGLSGDERRELLRENHRRIAQLVTGDEARALKHLEEALRLGVTPRDLRDDEFLGELRQRPAFVELLKRHEQQ